MSINDSSNTNFRRTPPTSPERHHPDRNLPKSPNKRRMDQTQSRLRKGWNEAQIDELNEEMEGFAFRSLSSTSPPRSNEGASSSHSSPLSRRRLFQVLPLPSDEISNAERKRKANEISTSEQVASQLDLSPQLGRRVQLKINSQLEDPFLHSTDEDQFFHRELKVDDSEFESPLSSPTLKRRESSLSPNRSHFNSNSSPRRDQTERPYSSSSSGMLRWTSPPRSRPDSPTFLSPDSTQSPLRNQIARAHFNLLSSDGSTSVSERTPPGSPQRNLSNQIDGNNNHSSTASLSPNQLDPTSPLRRTPPQSPNRNSAQPNSPGFCRRGVIDPLLSYLDRPESLRLIGRAFRNICERSVILKAKIETLGQTFPSSYIEASKIGEIRERLTENGHLLYTNAKKIRLKGHITAQSLEDLFAICPELTHLDLSTCNIQQEAFAVLANFRRLKFLNLSDTPIQREGIAHLPSSLEELDLSYCTQLDLDDSIQRLTHLEVLNLTQIRSIQVSSFSELTALKRAFFTDTDLSLIQLQTLPTSLEELCLESCSLLLDDSINRLVNLKILNLTGLDLANLNTLAHLNHLERLRFILVNATEQKVAQLFGSLEFLPHFKELVMPHTVCNLAIMQALAKIPTLKILDLSATELNDEAFNYFCQHNQNRIESLNLRECGLQEGFSELRRLRHLKDLDVSYTSFNHLDFLAHLPLESLNLERCKTLTPYSFRVLRSLPLSYLNLSNTDFHYSLDGIGNGNGLQRLSLDGVEIDEALLMKLQRLPHLETLSLRDARMNQNINQEMIRDRFSEVKIRFL